MRGNCRRGVGGFAPGAAPSSCPSSSVRCRPARAATTKGFAQLLGRSSPAAGPSSNAFFACRPSERRAAKEPRRSAEAARRRRVRRRGLAFVRTSAPSSRASARSRPPPLPKKAPRCGNERFDRHHPVYDTLIGDASRRATSRKRAGGFTFRSLRSPAIPRAFLRATARRASPPRASTPPSRLCLAPTLAPTGDARFSLSPSRRTRCKNGHSSSTRARRRRRPEGPGWCAADLPARRADAGASARRLQSGGRAAVLPSAMRESFEPLEASLAKPAQP